MSQWVGNMFDFVFKDIDGQKQGIVNMCVQVCVCVCV